MGIVTDVIRMLTGKGVSAAEAYPGSPAQKPSGPVAAVSLAEADLEAQWVKVRVTVISPWNMGGAACENAAWTVCRLLQNFGGSAGQGACRFLERLDSFFVEVTAVFSGEKVQAEWKKTPGFSAEIDGVSLPNAVAFTAKLAPPEKDMPMGWTFVLEEHFAPGESEENNPAEPFSITVKRAVGAETFTGCVLTGTIREDTPEGLRQIRQGTAADRSVISIL